MKFVFYLNKIWKNNTLVRVFRQDKALALATVVLALVALAPLWATPLFPFPDLGYNIGMASLLRRLILHHSFVQHFYQANWAPMPYWTCYLLMALLRSLGDVIFVSKGMLGLLVVLLPLATMRFLVSLHRSPRLGLWSFALVWDQNMQWGWVTFCLGMSLALIAMAKLLESRTLKDAFVVSFWSLLVALTHIHALVLLFAFGGLSALFRIPIKRFIFLHSIGLSGGLIAFAPWGLKILFPPSNGGETRQAFHFDYPPLQDKVAKLFDYSLFTSPFPSGTMWQAIAFVVLLFGPLCLVGLAGRPIAYRHRALSVLFLLVCGGLYFCLPFALSGPVNHWWTYPRFATFILLAGLTLPSVRFDGYRAFALLPGCFAAIAVAVTTFQQFRDFSVRATPYLEIMKAIRPHSRLFPLDIVGDDRAGRWCGSCHFHGMAAAAKSLYDPHLFDEKNNPVLHRYEHRLPAINWYKMREFSVDTHGVYYDYILVHPKERDPLHEGPTQAGPILKRVLDSGAWRLYEVVGRLPYPASTN